MSAPRLRVLPGAIALTDGALALAMGRGVDLAPPLLRHLAGDWGDLDAEDRLVNEAALRTGGRLFGVYRVIQTESIWIITEPANAWGERSTTTLLVPDEY